MNSLKLLALIVFLALCCIVTEQTSVWECYSCKSESDCKEKITCSPENANATTSYLKVNYKDVVRDDEYYDYDCFSDYLSAASVQQYKGCVYASINACGLAATAEHTIIERHCKQCSKDYCNPAARANINAWQLIGAIALVAVTKLTMQ